MTRVDAIQYLCDVARCLSDAFATGEADRQNDYEYLIESLTALGVNRDEILVSENEYVSAAH